MMNLKSPVKITAAFLVLLILFGSVILAEDKKPDMATAVNDNSDFAFSLYEKLKTGEGNLFFSPFSISTALAMTYSGARGNTAIEMEKALHFSLGQEKLHPATGSLIANLNNRKIQEGWGDNRKDVKPFELVVANALWGQKDYPFKKEFIDLNNTNYEAGLNLLDFKQNPEGSRKTINKWVEEKTNDRIKDLIQEGQINEDIRLVLTNAIYFKSEWSNKFIKRNTSKKPFHISKTETVDVSTMHQTDYFKYTKQENFELIELFYKGHQLSMLVLVPTEIDGMGELEMNLNRENLDKWLKSTKVSYISLALPKFKTDFKRELSDDLKTMGMKEAFAFPGADFSGMDGTKLLFISFVIHKAYVDVNEEGTEAAAATAVGMRAGSIPPKPIKLNVDRPFVFLIRDNSTGSILFMGRITKPEGY